MPRVASSLLRFPIKVSKKACFTTSATQIATIPTTITNTAITTTSTTTLEKEVVEDPQEEAHGEVVVHVARGPDGCCQTTTVKSCCSDFLYGVLKN